jgi:hypothetical protein
LIGERDGHEKPQTGVPARAGGASMPWRETSPMEQRLEFVREYETELFTMTELAEQYGISRRTGISYPCRWTEVLPMSLDCALPWTKDLGRRTIRTDQGPRTKHEGPVP